MITYDELKKLAALAKLSLDDEDADALIADISSILEFADAVAEAAGSRPQCGTRRPSTSRIVRRRCAAIQSNASIITASGDGSPALSHASSRVIR